ncbi:MAG: NAD-dependent epimerase/dehydratase family protein [Methylococcales bacterium]
MNILILGGHGFIGTHIIKELENAGHSLRVFARHPAKFKYTAEWVSGDFLDAGKLSEALVDMDAVVHCISTTVPATSISDPIYDIESNLIGTVKLLQLMQSQGVSRLIYISSGGTVYGNPSSNPVSETFPLNPISSYGAVKIAIEKFIEISRINDGLQSVILRPSNPYGEYQGHKGAQGLISTVLNNVIHSKTTMVYGDGAAIRDYIYVKDMAQLIHKVLSSSHTGIYNVGSGTGYSINEIIETIESVTGMTVPTLYKDKRGFDVKKIILDCTLAEENFDWKATTSLASGIKKQFNWLKNI